MSVFSQSTVLNLLIQYSFFNFNHNSFSFVHNIFFHSISFERSSFSTTLPRLITHHKVCNNSGLSISNVIRIFVISFIFWGLTSSSSLRLIVLFFQIIAKYIVSLKFIKLKAIKLWCLV